MTTLKPGDRVRLRGTEYRGEVVRVGTVYDEPFCEVRYDAEPEDTENEHPECLIKLKPPRKAREFWVMKWKGGDSGFWVFTEEPTDPSGEVIHVREVLKRKGSG